MNCENEDGGSTSSQNVTNECKPERNSWKHMSSKRRQYESFDSIGL